MRVQKGRNVLIGIIALVIAISACLGLSIRQAAENARTSALDGMSVTASISYDRQSMMGQMSMNKPSGSGMGGFDRDQFASMMGGASALTLEEYEKYAEADSVSDFYYTLTAYFNGTDALLPVSDSTEQTEDSTDTSDNTNASESTDASDGASRDRFPSGMGSMMGGFFSSGDFTVVGYSKDSAMVDFIDGTASILDGGEIFEEGTTEYSCIISEELAIYNSLSVGDTITITNPSDENESYTLSVTGIYSSTETNDFSASMFGASQDPANRIYMSSAALSLIIEASENGSSQSDGTEDAPRALSGTLDCTYVFSDAQSYYRF